MERSIGYVLGAYPVLSETFVSGEMRAMAALGVRVTPIVFDLTDTPVEQGDAEIRSLARSVSALPDRIPRSVNVRGGARALALINKLPVRQRPSAIRHSTKIAAEAMRSGCSHLHSHFGGGAAVHAISAARLAGVSCSFTVHSGKFERNFAHTSLIGPMVTEADFCVAPTSQLKENLERAGARDTKLIPCGADLERFVGDRGQGGSNGRLLFLGRLIDCKGADTLLEAIGRLHEAERPGLDIVGAGPELEALQRQAKETGLDVNFLGSKPNVWFAENGSGYIGLAAPFRRGLDGQEDSAPLVLKEAMSLGMPIVTTTLAGVGETVGDAAILFQPGDVDDLARAIGKLTAMTNAESKSLSDRAKRRAAGFGLQQQATLLLTAIKGLPN